MLCPYCASTGLSMGHGTGWVPCPNGCPQRPASCHPGGYRIEERVLRTVDDMIAAMKSQERSGIRLKLAGRLR